MTTYTSLYYHLIWATKKRTPWILEGIEQEFYAYIGGIIHGKKAIPIQIGGMPDHIHILTQVNPDQNIADLVKTIKTASGKWLKQTIPGLHEFHWQAGYGAFSVSKSQTNVVRQYIINQKSHHKKHGFKEELLIFLKNHGIGYNNDYVFD